MLSGAPFCPVPWRRQRLRYDEVDVCLWRNLKRELRLVICMGDGEIAGVDDVHAYQDIRSGEPAPADPDVPYQYPIWQPNVDDIHIGLIWLVANTRVHHFHPAYWPQPTLIGHLLGDQAGSRTGIPDCLEGARLSWGGARRMNLAFAEQNIRPPVGGYCKCVGGLRH